jgi:MinD-like ATPase involved in chromosome partitioning or flagellar assembly
MAYKVSMYSFKGGAGRTVTTANVARILSAERRKRVTVMDLDVESAGLSVLFGVDQKVESGECSTIQDVLRGFYAPESPGALADTINLSTPGFPETWRRIHVVPEGFNDVAVVPSRRILSESNEAGAEREPKRNFGNLLIGLDQLPAGPDFILFDSASGIQNTSLLALSSCDVLVVFFRWSRQFVRGTLQFLTWLTEFRNGLPRLSRIIVVPTAVPLIAPRADAAADVEARRADLANRVHKCNVEAREDDWIVLGPPIPEADAMKWDDCIIGHDTNVTQPELLAVVNAYRSLADMLVTERDRRRP